jgi:hypothetical protein
MSEESVYFIGDCYVPDSMFKFDIERGEQY